MLNKPVETREQNRIRRLNAKFAESLDSGSRYMATEKVVGADPDSLSIIKYLYTPPKVYVEAFKSGIDGKMPRSAWDRMIKTWRSFSISKKLRIIVPEQYAKAEARFCENNNPIKECV